MINYKKELKMTKEVNLSKDLEQIGKDLCKTGKDCVTLCVDTYTVCEQFVSECFDTVYNWFVEGDKCTKTEEKKQCVKN